jgi:hypothetical protein
MKKGSNSTIRVPFSHETFYVILKVIAFVRGVASFPVEGATWSFFLVDLR